MGVRDKYYFVVIILCYMYMVRYNKIRNVFNNNLCMLLICNMVNFFFKVINGRIKGFFNNEWIIFLYF